MRIYQNCSTFNITIRDVMTNIENNRRITNFKSEMIKELPFFPNDKKTLLELEGQGLNSIIINYLHWKTRLVPPRPRKIEIAPSVTVDKRWKILKPSINDLLKKISNGDDLYPYHSTRAHKNGYTPLQRIKDGEVDSWEDKDQLLNTKGFYHFHLSMNIQSSGIAARTDEVLFGYVTRDTFRAMGIFDHSVFEPVDNSGKMTSERERMWDLHEKYASYGMKPGTIYLSNPIMSSGHPAYLIRMCDYYTDIIRNIEPKLDDRDYINSIYKIAKIPPPSKFNFEWHFEGLDLTIHDKRTETYFTLQKGHI